MLWIPNQLEGAYIGQDVTLECHTEAYPTSINYWTTERGDMIISVPPMLWIPNQLEGAYIGQDVTLECHTEAYPTSINYWTTERGDMIIS
ncbi:hypothetical protein J437_LFUL009150, partial [Ladona fulva]